MLARKKVELFNIWLENQMDWDRVSMKVERENRTSNLNRAEWEAVQAKTLRASYTEDQFNDLIKKRTEANLYYKDEDFPEDPEERVQNSIHVVYALQIMSLPYQTLC